LTRSFTAFAGIARVGRYFWQALKEALAATAKADSQKNGTKGEGTDRTQTERRVAKPAAALIEVREIGMPIPATP
jgi:hypothetical protein